MRGAPGSGKSTLSRMLAESIFYNEGDYVICSTDSFFIKDGVYKFDPTKLGWAHTQNREKARAAMENGVELVIIDNTNTRRSDMAPYIQMAEQYGYNITEIVVGRLNQASIDTYVERNTHSVPRESIERMVNTLKDSILND